MKCKYDEFLCLLERVSFLHLSRVEFSFVKIFSFPKVFEEFQHKSRKKWRHVSGIYATVDPSL